MGDILYHVLVGNDAHPRIVAWCRGALVAVFTGLSAGMSAWMVSDIDSITEALTAKVVIGPALTAFIAVVLASLTMGEVDTWKQDKPPRE